MLRYSVASCNVVPLNHRSDMLFQPPDVAKWRRELIDWSNTMGADWYYQMIICGKQPIRPYGPPDVVARFLAEQEIGRLTDADLWFFESDTCELIKESHATMPPFSPMQTDLPSKSGFALFQSPIIVRDPNEDTSIKDAIDEFTRRNGGSSDPMHETQLKLLEFPISIVGVSWSPWKDLKMHPVGGVWMSFYAESNLHHIIDDPKFLARCTMVAPLLSIDNEVVCPWYPGGNEDRSLYILPDSMETTGGWARVVFAAFRLATQQGLSSMVSERLPRTERRRSDRAGLSAGHVTVVRLRGSSQRQSGGAQGTKHSHRYPVRGHWRNQWYPSAEDHRPIWIDQHIRGPEGTEFIGGDRVTIV